jgi:glutathione peroxidase
MATAHNLSVDFAGDQAMAGVYDYSVTDIHGKPLSLSKYKDKVLLIVNTASQCGFTPQYKGLEELHDKYAKRGLSVLGFPCNQFGAQEPGNEQEIVAFCERNYGVSFPLFSKIDVNGANTDPLYAYLKKANPGASGRKTAADCTAPSSIASGR